MKNLSGGKVIIKYVIIYLIKSLKQPVGGQPGGKGEKKPSCA
jgi:hypothetical protein